MTWQKETRGDRTPQASLQRRSMTVAFHRPRKRFRSPAVLLCFFSLVCSLGFARRNAVVLPRSNHAMESQPGARPAGTGAQNGRVQPSSRPHLGQWLRQHRNMSPQDQERALRNEPGFSRLPLPQQQRLLNRLRQLNAMPPQQRERTLQRMEALEKLSPQQREQVHSVMQEVGNLPQQRQRMMHKAFRDLSQLPPEQREAVLDSPQFRGQFSDREREMLGTLMSVQPYVPAQRPGVEYGGK